MCLGILIECISEKKKILKKDKIKYERKKKWQQEITCSLCKLLMGIGSCNKRWIELKGFAESHKVLYIGYMSDISGE